MMEFAAVDFAEPPEPPELSQVVAFVAFLTMSAFVLLRVVQFVQ